MNIIYFIASTFALACLSGVFYRLGGASPSDYTKAPKWLVKGVTRDIGCTLCAVAQLALAMHWFELDVQWWQVTGYILMCWWGCKSYWSWVNDIILKNKIKKAHQYTDDLNDKLGELGKITLASWVVEKLEEKYANKHWWNWLLVGITMWSRWLWITPWGLIPLVWNAWCIMDHSEKEDRVEFEEFGRGFLMII